jgi:hypothetical protein
MLLEALNFAATSIVSPRRKAGEINSSVMLWARARRCARAWAAHEQNCHAFILKAMEALPNRRVAVILGSGLLRDVPIEALSRTFDEVRLYDLQHLASVRGWAALKGLRNLRFEHRDISGFSNVDQDRVPKPLDFLEAVADLDFVISANVLSQIGIGLGRLSGANATASNDAVPRLLQAHVDGLKALATKCCLLTDTSYEVVDRAGMVLERDDLMQGILLPVPEAAWLWPVAPFGEVDPNYQAIHRVTATVL